MVGVPLEHLAAVPAATAANGRGDCAARFVAWISTHAFDARTGVIYDPASGAHLSPESTATLAGAAHRLFRYDISLPIARKLVRRVDVAGDALHAVAQVGIHWLFLGETEAAAAAAARVARDAASASTVRAVHDRALAAVFCLQWALAAGDPAAESAGRTWMDAAVAGVDSVGEPAVIAAVTWAAALVAAATGFGPSADLRALTADLVGRLRSGQSADGAWRGSGVQAGGEPATVFASTAWTSYRLACASAALALPEE